MGWEGWQSTCSVPYPHRDPLHHLLFTLLLKVGELETGIGHAGWSELQERAGCLQQAAEDELWSLELVYHTGFCYKGLVLRFKHQPIFCLQ